MTTIDFANAVLNWLLADPAHLVAAGSIIAAVTPTPAPNTVWGKVYQVVDMLALNVLHAKSTGQVTAPVDQIAGIIRGLLPPQPTPFPPAAAGTPAAPAANS